MSIEENEIKDENKISSQSQLKGDEEDINNAQETIKIIEDPLENKFRLLSSFSFTIVVILIGIPMWWKTTEVYRVNLPDSAIKELNSDPIQIKTEIFIYSDSPTRRQQLVTHLKEISIDNDMFDFQYPEIPEFDRKVTKTPAGLESQILKVINLKPGGFLFIEWPHLVENVLLTSERTGFFSSTANSKILQEVIDLIILKKYQITSILNEELLNRYRSSSSQLQQNYDVLLTVINSRPDILKFNWNINEATEIYLKPFLNTLSQISNYTIKSQWKYQIPFEFPIKQIRDNSELGRHYKLTEVDLPHMLTSVEKNLGIGVSKNPILNLVFYVPSCDIAPLYIYKTNGQRASNNLKWRIESFASTKWGGLIIYNPPIDICRKYAENQEIVDFRINSNEAMQIALYHILKYFDIQNDVTLKNIKIDPIDRLSPRIWELDTFLRRNTINYIYTSTRTLQSLIQLLDDISYIVINDDVGEAINKAYEMIEKAKHKLREGDLMAAGNYAKEAFVKSEHAFFDASLLAQLYFPDEQKYAIYIPLFLPIMVPVITSLASMLKLYKNSRENKIFSKIKSD